MIVWSTLEASCPICAQRVQLRFPGGAWFTGQDTDLFLRMGPEHVIQVEVQTCPKCRFSGYADDFLAEISPPEALRFVTVLSPLLARAREPFRDAFVLPERRPLPDVQYYWAFRRARFLGEGLESQALLLLRAYWCLRIPPSDQLPDPIRESRKKLYLRGAIERFRQLAEKRPEPKLLYITAEICRRNSNFRLAVSYFRRHLLAEGGPRYLRRAAQRLLEAAREKDARDLSMEEILFDRPPEPERREKRPAESEPEE